MAAAEPEPKSLRDRLARLAGTSRTERLLAAGTLIAAVIAIVSFALLDTDDDPRTTEFRAAADEQCVAAKREVVALNESSPSGDGGAQQAFTSGLLEAVAAWWVAYDSLDPPADLSEPAATLNEALIALMIDLGTLSRTARTGSQAEISEAAAVAEATTGDVEAQVTELELTQCAQLSLGAPPTAR